LDKPQLAADMPAMKKNTSATHAARPRVNSFGNGFATMRGLATFGVCPIAVVDEDVTWIAVRIATGSTTVGVVRGDAISDEEGTMVSTLHIGHTKGLPAWRKSTESGFLHRLHRKKINMGLLPRT
jgi:hypothetical protein